MNFNDLNHLMGLINEDILYEADYKEEKSWLKNKNIMRIAICTGIITALLLIILPITLNHTNTNSISETEGTLPGATEINPAVMYNGTIYYWEKLAWLNSKGRQQSPPEGYQYVGDIQYIDGDKLEQDFQFIAKFNASGQVFYSKDTPDSVYICITTYWLKNTYVIFKKQG